VVGSAVLLSLGVAPTLALADDPIGGAPSITVPSVPEPPIPDPPTPPPLPDLPLPDLPVPDPGTGGGDGGSGGDGNGGSSGGSPDAGGIVDVVETVIDPGSGSGSVGSQAGDAAPIVGTTSAASATGSSAPSSGRGRRDESRASRTPDPRSRATSFDVRPRKFKARGKDRKNRGTTLVFHLTRASLVRFTIYEIWPGCELEGSFLRAGQKGTNRIAFSGRLQGEPLAPGTYRVVVKPVGSNPDRSTQHSTFAIVPPRGSPQETAVQASTCRPAEATYTAGSGATGDAGLQSGTAGKADPRSDHAEKTKRLASGTWSGGQGESGAQGTGDAEAWLTEDSSVFLLSLLGGLSVLALVVLAMVAHELRSRFR
jgi:hypothetical protein